MASDEDDWNRAAALCQLALQVESAHARQLHVENETRSAFRSFASQEISRGRKRLDPKSCRLDQALR